MRCCAAIVVFGLINAVVYAAIVEECDSDRECAVQWPESTCRNSRCICPPNFVRRASLSRGWICLSLQDAATGQLGPPLTCPLPSGAGYRLILKNENGTVVFCHSKHNPDVCGVDHECIRAIGTFSADWDGVCCPRKELSCNSSSINVEQVGWIDRWYFDGKECVKFKWNPEETSSANTFLNRQHCQTYCE
ncbi:BPTI/Kunitz inhibitor domain-containing protein [Aphelenchoides besseyi]|nr:BPTI/Kunitz inhibitor domain-containing protein [Aphelenchoides besseyi]